MRTLTATVIALASAALLAPQMVSAQNGLTVPESSIATMVVDRTPSGAAMTFPAGVPGRRGETLRLDPHPGSRRGNHSPPRLLFRWRRKFEGEGKKAFPGSGVARDQELLALKRELAKVKRERDFLRDADPR